LTYPEAPGKKTYQPYHKEPAKRFTELGIHEAFPYFESWVFHGAFNLHQKELYHYEQAFWLINSILPDEVINSYGNLPEMYRALSFEKHIEPRLSHQLYRGGIPLKSRIMAWSPNLKHVQLVYSTEGFRPYVIMKHQPRASEVMVALNGDTMEFLHVDPRMVVNRSEAIMSLPILKCTPDMVLQTNIPKPQTTV
jgi:hypothetical protein